MKEEVFWKNPGYKPRKPLTKNIECDYLIIGGGVTGVSTAYFLSKNSAKNIVLIEKNIIARGATGKSAGMLSLRGELDISETIKEFGSKKGWTYWYANHDAFHTMKRIIKEESIKCESEEQPTIYGEFKYKTYHDLDEEYKYEKKLYSKSKLLSGKDLKKEINTNLFKRAILSPGHAISVNPLMYTQNLSKLIERRGVRVYENTPLNHIRKDIAITPKAKIKFKKIIYATDKVYHSSHVYSLKSTIIVTQRLTKQQLKDIGLLNKKTVWDAKRDYDYLKITKDNRIMIGCGGIRNRIKDIKTEAHDTHFKQAKLFLKRLFPQLNVRIDYGWSGSFGVTDGFIPLVKIEENKVVIVGGGAQVACTMIAKYAAHKLLNKNSPLDGLFKARK